MSPLELIARYVSVGDAGAAAVLADLALEHGWTLDVIPDEWAEYDRVRSATGMLAEVPFVDRVPRPWRVVLCGGLRAVEPDAGRGLKPWMLRFIARLWSWRGPDGRRRRWELTKAQDLAAKALIEAGREIELQVPMELR